jgi:cobalt-zinc-cadmium efflux system protein
MTRRTLDVALPRAIDCSDCADALHLRLSETAGVSNVTVDHVHRKVFVEVEDDDAVYGNLVGELTRIFVGDDETVGLDARHRRYHTTRTSQDASKARAARSSVRPELARASKDGFAERREAAMRNRKRLGFVLVAGTLIMASQVIGGLLANSLVLLADAAHYATDIVAVMLAFLAIGWGMKQATGRKTFGYERVEVVAAFLQAIGLWAISLYLLWESYQRILDPPEVGAPIVIIVGGASLVANLGLAWVLHQGSGQNINVRAAYLHILSDVLGSAAALVAGVLVYWRGWHVADPILTLFITALILVFTVRLTRQTLHILLEGSPRHLDPVEVEASLKAIDGVQEVHDLHVWTLTSGVDSLSAHVVLANEPLDDRVAHAIHERIRERYRIEHITVQVESPECPCDTFQHRWHTGPRAS